MYMRDRSRSFCPQLPLGYDLEDYVVYCNTAVYLTIESEISAPQHYDFFRGDVIRLTAAVK